jgi:hypothetical protein
MCIKMKLKIFNLFQTPDFLDGSLPVRPSTSAGTQKQGRPTADVGAKAVPSTRKRKAGNAPNPVTSSRPSGGKTLTAKSTATSTVTSANSTVTSTSTSTAVVEFGNKSIRTRACATASSSCVVIKFCNLSHILLDNWSLHFAGCRYNQRQSGRSSLS